MNLYAIYCHSPIFLQNLMTSVQGLIFRNERYGKIYRSSLKEFCNRDYTNAVALNEYQDEQIIKLIRHATRYSPFYRDFYRNVDVEGALKRHNISAFPILEKETVRQNISQMYTIPPQKGIVSNTSGTTGTSLCFVHTKDDFQRRMAYLDAFKMKHGFVPMKMKRASFSSAKVVPPNSKSKIFWRDNVSIRQRIYSGYHCKCDNIPYYVDNLNSYKPESLDGYPSALYEIADYIIRNNITLNFTPIAIFPTAETLLPHYKETISTAFKCPVRNQYASSEGAPFITECENGNLHVCTDTGFIEFLPDGRMLMTCFMSYGTPLIRYDIGDKAKMATEQSCSCGCAMPVVDSIEGRTMDYIQSPNGGKFSAIYLSLVSKDFNNCMKAMQFVQNDLYHLNVNIATDDSYHPSMDQIIINKLQYSLGNDVKISVNRMTDIPKEPSGKFRFIINNLKEGSK